MVRPHELAMVADVVGLVGVLGRVQSQFWGWISGRQSGAVHPGRVAGRLSSRPSARSLAPMGRVVGRNPSPRQAPGLTPRPPILELGRDDG